jgi:hypothetical protein
MSDELIQLNHEVTEQARRIVEKHIDELNRQFNELIDRQIAEHKQFSTFSKRSTWLTWVLFWTAGFLARGIFEGPVQWNLASYATGLSTGVLVYFFVYAGVQWTLLRHKMKEK